MGQGPAKPRRQAKRLSIAEMLRARPASIRLLATAGSRLKNSRARRPPPRPPRKPPPPPPPPPAASASAAAAEPPPNNSGEDGKTSVEWLLSAERTAHLEHNEKWIMRIGVFFTGLAIASFTWTKWEVEKRLKDELNDEERKQWYAGTYDHERAVFTREQAKMIEERACRKSASTASCPRRALAARARAWSIKRIRPAWAIMWTSLYSGGGTRWQLVLRTRRPPPPQQHRRIFRW